MKLLVFAHTPPPHHGQSYMVELLLKAFGGDRCGMGGGVAGPQPPGTIECYQVNARFSDGMMDIGRVRLGKILLLLKYCWQAIRCRFRFGARTMLYIPAPPLRSAIYRDWLVMAICRPFFHRRIFYWQAAGLGEWLASTATPGERALTRLLLGRPDLSIVLGKFCLADAEALGSKRAAVVPNGIPDPCPDFSESVLPLRLERAGNRGGMKTTGPRRFHLLFLGLCTREKGLFDALEAVALLNQRLRQTPSPVVVQLTVAGKFWRDEEEREFIGRVARPDLNGGLSNQEPPVVRQVGFVAGADKLALLRDSDCLCFPTFYQSESFGIVLIEAMAFGLPVVTTRWRTIPELLPEGYAGLVEPNAPGQLANAIERLLHEGYDPQWRARFLERFTADKTFARLRDLIMESGAD